MSTIRIIRWRKNKYWFRVRIIFNLVCRAKLTLDLIPFSYINSQQLICSVCSLQCSCPLTRVLQHPSTTLHAFTLAVCYCKHAAGSDCHFYSRSLDYRSQLPRSTAGDCCPSPLTPILQTAGTTNWPVDCRGNESHLLCMNGVPQHTARNPASFCIDSRAETLAAWAGQ